MLQILETVALNIKTHVQYNFAKYEQNIKRQIPLASSTVL